MTMQGPLRESRRQNVGAASTHPGTADQQYHGSDPKFLNEAGRSQQQQQQQASSSSNAVDMAGNSKPSVTIHDASLLLGLRTSASGSPSTAQTGTEEDNYSKASTYAETLSFRDDGPPSRPMSTSTFPDASMTSEGDGKIRAAIKSDFPCPVPKNYPKRLALPGDDTKLNSLHCFVRQQLLEIFVVEQSKNKSPTHSSTSSSVGRVGLRCVHCAIARKRGTIESVRFEAPMAVFYPKSISEIYRLVTSWQRCHLRKCRNLPPSVRAEWENLREVDKSRGKTFHWIASAKEIGLVDCQSRAGGIKFDLPEEKDGAEEKTTDVVCQEGSSQAKPSSGDAVDATAASEKQQPVDSQSPQQEKSLDNRDDSERKKTEGEISTTAAAGGDDSTDVKDDMSATKMAD